MIRFTSRAPLPAGPGLADFGEPGTTVGVSNMVLAREAALAGAGVAVLADFLVRADVAAGTLVPVLPQAPLPPLEISLLHPFSQTPPRRVTVFLDFLLDQWRRGGFLIA